VFAHLDFDFKDRVGKYGINLDILEQIGVHAIEKAITDEDVDIIIIDEIGKMEMLSEKFCDIVIDALDSDKPIMVTLHKKSRTPLLQDIRRRDDIRILEVTAVNRNLLPYKIENIMTEKLPPLF
jgi:nucleoside-triphosphatase